MAARICLVDDTPDLLNNLTEVLRMEGFEIFSFPGGREALQFLYGNDAVVPDLIITDLWMPAMDGFVFIESVKRDPALIDVPVVIFSAKPPQEYERQAHAHGVTEFIKKPADIDDILNVIYSLINQPQL